jgi:predicted O-methyltransferase YrrM
MDPEIPVVDPRIEAYLERFPPRADAIRAEMETLAAARRFPIVGPLVGSALDLLARAIGARRVFEMGSGFGYSALWFSRALGPDGLVLLTDGSKENCQRASGYLERAGVADRARVECGNALEIAEQALDAALPGLPAAGGLFDIVFCDIDKQDYPLALPRARRLLRPGGLFLVDNMIWFGKVAALEPREPSTVGVLELGRLLRESSDFRTVILPLRDGLAVCLKS